MNGRRRVQWLGLAGALLLLLLWQVFGVSTPTFRDVKASYQSSDVKFLARDGQVLDEVRLRFDGRRLDWTPLKEVSPAFLKALLATEDQRFVGHPGVDLWALGHAVMGLGRSKHRRGASTITMQLTGLLQERRSARRRTVADKLRQMRDALAIERHWTKAQILEAYVNLVGFRGEQIGVRAAARNLFDKGPNGLDLGDSVLLAAMIAEPNAAPPVVVRRACAVATRLQAKGRCQSLATQFRLAMTQARGQGFVRHRAPQAARRWLKEHGAKDGVVQSTLDAELQRTVTEEVEAQLRELTQRNVRDAAVMILDNASGDVLAYVGSSPSTSRAPEVDGVTAKRQAGSILKPFLYELAFKESRLTAATLLDDSPLEIEVSGGVYQPRNYDKVFRGAVTAREALASSLNVPAVKVLELVGIEAYWQRLKDLGFGVDQEAQFFGPSLALGTADVTLEELTRAYRALALRSTREAPARTVADVLSDRVARSGTFGLENYLSTRFFTAVKTGTSKDMRDNWCVGFSERYTVGVWVGNFGGDPMWNVSGVTGAAPIWLNLMRHLQRRLPSAAPALDVKTETPQELIVDPLVLAKITYPTDGMVVAWDPDLLPSRQAILPEVTPRAAAVTLELDGKPWPRGKAILLQGLAKGRHVLVLKGPGQKSLDQAAFLVGTRLANTR